MLILKLVFLLWRIVGVMAYFLTVIVLNYFKVMCYPVKTIFVLFVLLIRLNGLGCIDSGSQSGALLLLLIISIAFLLFLLPNFSRNSDRFEHG